MALRTTIRNRLPRLLALRRCSDGDLARLTGLSRSHINRLKNRRIRPTLRDGLLLSEALGLAVERIFELHEQSALTLRWIPRKTGGSTIDSRGGSDT